MKNQSTYSLSGKKVWITGHNGMVGNAIMKRLQKENCDILTVERNTVDLRQQNQVDNWVTVNNPDVIFLVAAKVGGIHANATYPANFLYDNLMIEANVIAAAKNNDVEKLLFLASNCTYPRETPQPIKEEYLLTGPLEPSNQWYAIAKIAGISLCQSFHRQYGCNFIAAMPVNIYGPKDNFHPENSHLPAGLLSRFHEAKSLEKKEAVVWGSGKPYREFLHVDDLADACTFLIKHYNDEEIINVGTGKDTSIADFAALVAKTVGFEGKIVFDTTRPDGTFRKVLDVSKITALGWSPKIKLEDGLMQYYDWYLKNMDKLRKS